MLEAETLIQSLGCKRHQKAVIANADIASGKKGQVEQIVWIELVVQYSDYFSLRLNRKFRSKFRGWEK